jgi:hypothetical protein
MGTSSGPKGNLLPRQRLEGPIPGKHVFIDLCSYQNILSGKPVLYLVLNMGSRLVRLLRSELLSSIDRFRRTLDPGLDTTNGTDEGRLCSSRNSWACWMISVAIGACATSCSLRWRASSSERVIPSFSSSFYPEFEPVCSPRRGRPSQP